MPLLDADRLRAELLDLALRDDTGDPHDEGYMAALSDVREIIDTMTKENE